MTRRLAVCLASLIPFVTAAQQPDHLLPEDSAYGGDYLADYALTVGEVLGRAPLPYQSPKMVVIPSFAKEYVVGLDREQCVVVSGEAQHHLWTYQIGREDPSEEVRRLLATFPVDPLDVQLSVQQRDLDRPLCERISLVWASTLLGTRYASAAPEYLTTDGVTFHFSTWVSGLGTLSGMARSPERNSIPGKLVALGAAMRRFAGSGTVEDLRALEESLDAIEMASR